MFLTWEGFQRAGAEEILTLQTLVSFLTFINCIIMNGILRPHFHKTSPKNHQIAVSISENRSP